MVACPNEDTLVAFARRGLDAGNADAVASHLDDCESCRHAVRAGAEAISIAVGTQPLGPMSGVAIGARIGRYEIRRLLGAGGMGRVYVAYDSELEREVALKVLRPELADRADLLAQRLLRESRLTAKVTHPAVMTIYDVGRVDDVVFIAMELIHGETLGAFVARTQPDWRTCVAMYERAASGLAAAHAAGIVHRDFKPDNVLVDATRVVVSDFGIARAAAHDDLIPSGSASPDARLTATGLAIGTPAYMAPEQLAGAAVDQRADIFAFAVSLWEAIFGARPFVGPASGRVRASRGSASVPRRLLRALERGLAIDPEDRWPDLASFTAELAAIRGRKRRVQLGALAAGLVGAGLVGAWMTGALALAQTTPAHPCARGFAALDRSYDRAAVERALASDPAVQQIALATLDNMATRFRVTQASTCLADRVPAQPPAVTSCLDARLTELAGVTADLLVDGPTQAKNLVSLISAPNRCAKPAPALQFSRVPEDPVLRRKVTALRYRAFAAEATRNDGDFAKSIAAARSVADDAANVWPPVAAETLYLLGATESQGGDGKAGVATLKQAAALAESAHHDYIAASTWIQLVMSATFDEGEWARGLEYITYADAALERLGRPPDVDALFQYAKGTTLVEAMRLGEAEVALRRAVEIAERAAPDYLPQAIQGLGYLYESQGRYQDAVAAYRDALAHLAPSGSGVITAQIVFKGRLAINLSTMGQTHEAVTIALEALQLADAKLDPDNSDRAVAHANYAQVLEDDGQADAALREIRIAGETLKRTVGERGERYGEALRAEGVFLDDHERFAEAEPKLARACDVIAFAAGEGSEQQADCWTDEVTALSGLHRNREALALIDKAFAILKKTYSDHPKIANVLVARGIIHSQLDHHAAAVADLEAGAAMFANGDTDTGHLAAAKFALGQELWTTDRPRAHALITSASDLFATAAGTWASGRDDVEEWLATNGHPRVHHSGL